MVSCSGVLQMVANLRRAFTEEDITLELAGTHKSSYMRGTMLRTDQATKFVPREGRGTTKFAYDDRAARSPGRGWVVAFAHLIRCLSETII